MLIMSYLNIYGITMSKRVFLYTPWQEQGLSYDAKVIEQIFLDHGYQPIITYRTRKKVKWDCEFMPINSVHNNINPEDVFFSFEVFPVKHIENIKAVTDHLFHMVNYEFYEPDLNAYLNQYQKVFCKSKIALDGLKGDGLINIVYQPWILHEFPISDFRPASHEVIKVLFNGGTGGYKERRNLEAIVNLIQDYPGHDVQFTIKLTKKIQRWSKAILRKHSRDLRNDQRVTLIQENFDRDEYISFLNQFDVNLAPSKFEGFGLTLLEGLHANLPTLTLDISPLNEIIRHGETGICVSSRQIDALRNQPIFEADRTDLLMGFRQLIADRTQLNKYKEDIGNTVIQSIESFKQNMGIKLFE